MLEVVNRHRALDSVPACLHADAQVGEAGVIERLDMGGVGLAHRQRYGRECLGEGYWNVGLRARAWEVRAKGRVGCP
jgi:hypothetical protein